MTTHPTALPLPTKLARRWAARRTFPGERMPPLAALCAVKHAEGVRISVGIPALNEDATIGPICRVISRELMEKTHLVDELVVLDGASVDQTALRAEAAGARVIDVATLLPAIPLVPGKGESLWRSLTALSGDIVVWIDADIHNFASHFVTRLIAPMLMDTSVDFVKASYRRPLHAGGTLLPSGGGRVTELLARPLLALLFPELSGFAQPLSGEYAGRAEVLRRVPFFSGYSVEAGLLIDLLEVTGLDGMAQVDLGSRVHRNRPLEELGPMAYGIARSILRRAEERGRIKSLVDAGTHPLLQYDATGTLEVSVAHEVERPPIELTSHYVAALRAADLADATPP